MTKREALRLVVLTTFAGAFGRFDLFAATPAGGTGGTGGTIKANLSQWKWLVFEHHGKRIAVPTEEVFQALEAAYGSVKI